MPTPSPTPRYATGGLIPAPAGVPSEHDDRIPVLLSEGGCYSHNPYTGRPGPGPDPWATALAAATAAGQSAYLLVQDEDSPDTDRP